MYKKLLVVSVVTLVIYEFFYIINLIYYLLCSLLPDHTCFVF
jgi:hypothetical protein